MNTKKFTEFVESTTAPSVLKGFLVSIAPELSESELNIITEHLSDYMSQECDLLEECTRDLMAINKTLRKEVEEEERKMSLKKISFTSEK